LTGADSGEESITDSMTNPAFKEDKAKAFLDIKLL
jgi:hypothetical protein